MDEFIWRCNDNPTTTEKKKKKDSNTVSQDGGVEPFGSNGSGRIVTLQIRDRYSQRPPNVHALCAARACSHAEIVVQLL